MIIRLWRGKTPRDKADEYEIILRRTGLADYTSVDGLLAYYFTRNDRDTYTDFLLITHWDSIESIKEFAGDDYHKAKYYPEDHDFLLEFPEFVEHFQVFEHANAT